MPHTLDALGLLCPLPVLKLRKRLIPLASDEEIEVLTDDPAAVIDIPHFCQETGHHVVNMTQEGAQTCWIIRKK